MRIRRARLALALVLLTPIVLLFGALPAQAASYSGTVVQWNLSGNSRYHGSTTPAQILVNNVKNRSRKPVAIVTNETCSTQYDYLARNLASYGYQPAYNWAITPASPQPLGSSCPSYGNAVFYRGKLLAEQKQAYAAQIYGPGTNEQRNILCVTFQAEQTGPTMRVCGTHLHQDDAMAAQQLSEAYPIVVGDGTTAQPKAFLVGDLNMAPALAALDPWYGQFSEVDGTNRTTPRRTVTSGEKLDYVFAPRPAATVTPPAKIEFQAFSSDHAIYTGTFSLN